MTRRERLERKLEKRQEWAEGRDRKAAEASAYGDRFRGDVAFNTQPGHIPERARVIRKSEQAAEHHTMARHHESKAAGLERQLAGSIFSDDPDAVEALEAKAAAIEAEADQAVRVNKAWRKAGKPRPDNLDGWRKVADILGADNDPAGVHERYANLLRIRAEMARDFIEREPFPSYHTTNLRANARRLRERIKDVGERQAREAAAEAAPDGVLIARHEAVNWCSVTFADKPERGILEALRAAGYGWGGGRWSGYLDRLPACVADLAGGQS